MEKINFNDKFIENYNKIIDDDLTNLISKICNYSGFYCKPLTKYFKLDCIITAKNSIENFKYNNSFSIDEVYDFDIEVNKLIIYIINDLTGRLIDLIENKKLTINKSIISFLKSLVYEYTYLYKAPILSENTDKYHIDDKNFSMLFIVDTIFYSRLLGYQNSNLIMNDKIINQIEKLKDIFENYPSLKNIFEFLIDSNKNDYTREKAAADLLLNKKDCIKNFINNKMKFEIGGHFADFNSINLLFLLYSGDHNNDYFKNNVNLLLEEKIRKTPKIQWIHYYTKNNIKLLTEICDFVTENKDKYNYNTKNIKKINSIRLNNLI